jgi:uncharacterized Zn-binding protein involved in type VI secretion
MKRYTITLGATTTVGGKIISASGNGSNNGVRIALEDDLIFCPACNSQGKILCVEPRIPETWNGKKVALENDLCLCGCPNLPRLVPNQSLRYQTLRDDNEGTSARAQDAMNAVKAESMFDDDTGEALPSTEYALRRANGQVEFGTTDDKGHTHLLAAEALAESIEIYS